MTGSKKDLELPALTGIRFIAVSMVFMTHCVKPYLSQGYCRNVVNNFHLSLNIFFVLSGFIIAYKYDAPAGFGRKFLVTYFMRRFSRVYPLYFLLTTCTFILFFFSGRYQGQWLTVYLLNITFLKGFSSWFMFTGIFPTWSLTVEETFYLLFPLISMLHKRYALFYSQIIALWGVGFLLLLIFRAFPFHGFFKGWQFVAMATFFGRCFEFFVGIRLALFIRARGLGDPSRLAQHPQKKPPLMTSLGLSIMAMTLLVMAALDQSTMSAARIAMGNLIFPVGVALFFYGLIAEGSLVKKWLSSPVAILLGQSSYAFFIVHTSFFQDWTKKYVVGEELLPLYIVLYGISILLYKFVENPLNQYLRKIGSKWFEKPPEAVIT